VYDDLNLIFLNALHYNIEDSQIAKDANTLKVRERPWANGFAVTGLTRAVFIGNPRGRVDQTTFVTSPWSSNVGEPTKRSVIRS